MPTSGESLELARNVTNARVELMRILSNLVGLPAPDLVRAIERFMDAKIDLEKKS